MKVKETKCFVSQVEQLHKIFKLCGTPSDDYWEKTMLPRTTSFKLQQPYKRRLVERFKDLPSSALKLVEKLLALETDRRGSASSALKSEVLYLFSAILSFFPWQDTIKTLSNLTYIVVTNSSWSYCLGDTSIPDH